jgi:hypothetical protein
MPDHDLFQISKIFEDCLNKVKNLKSLNVRFQRYEQSAIKAFLRKSSCRRKPIIKDSYFLL